MQERLKIYEEDKREIRRRRDWRKGKLQSEMEERKKKGWWDCRKLRTRCIKGDEVGEGGKADIAEEKEMDQIRKSEKRRALQISRYRLNV